MVIFVGNVVYAEESFLKSIAQSQLLMIPLVRLALTAILQTLILVARLGCVEIVVVNIEKIILKKILD